VPVADTQNIRTTTIPRARLVRRAGGNGIMLVAREDTIRLAFRDPLAAPTQNAAVRRTPGCANSPVGWPHGRLRHFPAWDLSIKLSSPRHDGSSEPNRTGRASCGDHDTLVNPVGLALFRPELSPQRPGAIARTRELCHCRRHGHRFGQVQLAKCHWPTRISTQAPQHPGPGKPSGSPPCL